MNFDWSAATVIRILLFVVLAAAASFILIRLLKFIGGVIIGFIVTLLLAYLYFKSQM